LAATVQLGGRTVGRDVLVGIHDASHKTGVNFAYMLAKANQESGFRPDATNPRGTASGLFQFTRATWLDQIAQHGEKHGLGDFSRQIVLDARGRPRGRTPEVEQQILALRADPRVSAMMAAEYAAENKAYLERALGRPADATDIYLAHFLGPGGAVTFLRGMAVDPGTPAARLLPKAAANNPTIFSQDGGPRSLRQVHAVLRATIQDAMRRFSGATRLAEVTTPPAPPGARPAAPPPMERGWGLAGTPPPSPPGHRPEGPDRADLIPLYLAANPPAPPGQRPQAPDRADLMSPEVAARMPPVPGPRPDPGASRTDQPDPAPGPAPDIRVAGGAPVSSSPGSPTGDSMVDRVLHVTRAVEAAGAARKLDLPGPSALAMAAMLDDLFHGEALPAERVLVLDPVAGLTHVPASGSEVSDSVSPTMTPPEAVPAAPPSPAPSRPDTPPPERWAAADPVVPTQAAGPSSMDTPAPAAPVMAAAPEAPADADTAHPAISRILAVGRSVSAAPGEAQVSLAVPTADDVPMSTETPVDALTAALVTPDPPSPATRPAGGTAPVPTARPATGDAPGGQAEPAVRWRTAAAGQLAESDANRAISAILGRPNSG